MSIQRTYYCDGPPHSEVPSGDQHEDRCPVHAATAGNGLPGGFIRVVRGRGEYGAALHFCGWGCVMRYAAQQPVPEIIEMGDLP